MLVLLSFGLVLVATVLLVLGLLVGDGLTLIYISILLSAAAAIILFVAVRVSKPKVAPAGLPSPLAPEPTQDFATVGAPAAEATATMPVMPPPLPAPPPPPPPPPAPVAQDEEGNEWLAADQEWEEAEAEWEGEELEFPIADYEELTVDEILPLLPQLYTDELDVVEEREAAGQKRAAIIDELRRLRAAAGGVVDAPAEEVADEVEAPYEEFVGDQFFPIEDYDHLEVSEIVDLLGELDDDELADVRAYEAARDNRRTIIQNIDRRLAPPPPPRQAAPARKAAAPAPKRAPAKRATAAPKKAAPVKKAAATGRAPKKAAPVKKAATAAKKAAPVKKAAATTKKAATKKAAAPVKKATKKR